MMDIAVYVSLIMLCVMAFFLILAVAAICGRERPITPTKRQMESLELVKEFHLVYGHRIEPLPNISHQRTNLLRVRLLAEELSELEKALIEGDAVGTFDALLDMQYVLDGAFLALGFHGAKGDGMAEVHNSNMSKLGLDGKPIYDDGGKVVKGPNYRPPNLLAVLEKKYHQSTIRPSINDQQRS